MPIARPEDTLLGVKTVNRSPQASMADGSRKWRRSRRPRRWSCGAARRRFCPGPLGGVSAHFAFSTVNQLCTARLYVRMGCATAENGGFRPRAGSGTHSCAARGPGPWPAAHEAWSPAKGLARAVLSGLRSTEGRAQLRSALSLSLGALVRDLTEGRPDCRRFAPALPLPLPPALPPEKDEEEVPASASSSPSLSLISPLVWSPSPSSLMRRSRTASWYKSSSCPSA